MRLMTRLEIKGAHVVKGIRMEGLRRVGSPDELMARYFAQGIDEIVFNDIVATLYGRNHLTDLLQSATSGLFIPLTAGGGVRSLEGFHALLRSGADKVSINSQAVRTPELITEAARVFGSQCVVVEVQPKRREDGSGWEPYIENGRERTHLDLLSWVREVEDRGAGEVLLTSVDRDGTIHGLDVELVRQVTDVVGIPVIAAGGAQGPDDIAEAVHRGRANAVSVSNLLHFEKTTVSALKGCLATRGVPVRPADLN